MMAYRRLIESARQTFAALPADRNVLILHPQFRYHNALIEALVEAAGRRVLYVTLPHPGTDLAAVWDALAAELGGALPLLGAMSPAAAAEAFWRVVGSGPPLMMVLGAYDFAEDSVHDFVARLAAQRNELARFGEAASCIIMLESRVWPSRLIDRLDTPDRVVTLPVSAEDMLLDYMAADRSRVLLEVRTLGPGQVLVDGRKIEQWDGALPRALFFYFVDRGMTTRDEVFMTFWPDLSTREATNVFHVTKRKISEILNVDLTVYSSGFYRIAPNIDLHYDVVSFAEAVQNSAVAEPDEAQFLLERAISLHERDFLRDFDQAWVVRRRGELRAMYVDALTALARLYEDRGLNTEALGLYNRAFGVFPQREDLARSQMRLYEQSGHASRALLVFDRLADELRTSLNVAPSPETEALAEAVRQKMAPA